MHEHPKQWRSESEDRLRAFIEHAPRKMWISRTDGTVEFVNGRWREYTGQSENEAAPNWRDFIHPEDRSRVEAVRNGAMARGEPYDVQARLRRHRDGAYRWHIGRVAPVHLHGELIAWIGAATDIDARIRDEAALRESESNFRTLADAIPQLVWMRNPAQGDLWLNQRWFAFTDTSMEQMQGDGWRDVIHPDHIAPMMDVVRQARAEGRPWEYTAPLRRKDGAYRWFLFRGEPIRDEASGQIDRWFGTATDVQGQQETQERQRLLTQEVSHRVKNSLALVASQLALQARAADDETARSVLMDAYARVQTIAGVHDHLWRQYDTKIIELSGFLSDLCLKLQETSPGHEVIFTGTRTVISTDQAVPIGLIVNELVTNALKYAYPAGREGSIWVSLSRSVDGVLNLDVVDKGVGVPQEFDLFAPTKSLGMRFIVNTIRQLGANASVVRTTPGTAFKIQIPTENG